MTPDTESDDSRAESEPDTPAAIPDEVPDGGAGRGLGARVLAGVREFVLVGLIALGLSFLVKTFLVQAFFIPSESMEDTLIEDDRVVVSKFTPDLIDIKRGDIVVFEDPGGWLAEVEPQDRGAVLNVVRQGLTFVGLLPDTAEGHLIKRVIGLPGDRVVCCDETNRLTLNGVALSEEYVKPGEDTASIPFEITVPDGKIWVMGDNRGHSSDSRLHDPSGDGSDGSVDVDLVVGRAFVTVWPISRVTWLPNYADAFAGVPRESPR